MKLNENTINSILNNIDESHLESNWKITETKTSFRASNYFTSMRDLTFRSDFIVPFTIIFSKTKPFPNYKLQFNGQTSQSYKKTGMRDYLIYSIESALNSYISQQKPQQTKEPQTGDGW